MFEVKGHLIGGMWVRELEGVPPKQFGVRDRSTNAIIANVPTACDEQVHLAVSNAHCIWRDGQWCSRTSLVHRAECMLRASVIAERRREEIVEVMLAECGKTRVECHADVTEGIHMMQAAYARGRMGRVGEVVRGEHSDRWSEVQHVSIGPCVAIAPWNFPFALPVWLTAVPMVAGNPVILKPAEQTPLCAQLLAEIYVEAGVPAGVFQMLQGDGSVGENLVRDSRVARVLFTGSSVVAAHLTHLQAVLFPHRLPMVAECGGKNVIAVMPLQTDAHYDMAAKAVAMSICRTSGQRCVSCSRVVVHKDAMGTFVLRLQRELDAQVIGDPRKEGVTMGPLIDADAVKRWQTCRDGAMNTRLVALHDPGLPHKLFESGGNWAAPSVWKMDRNDESPFQREEFFVPFAVVIPVDSLDEAIDVANATNYGLAAGIFSDDPRELARFEVEVHAGIIYENMAIIGAEVQLPFGGEKNSGRGMASADGLWHAVTRERAITRNVGEGLPLAQGLK